LQGVDQDTKRVDRARGAKGESAGRRGALGGVAARRPPAVRVRNAEAELIRSARRRLAAATDSELTDDDVLALLIQRHLSALEEELRQEYLRGPGVAPDGGVER
jgi:hypothetical protein